MDIRLTSTVFQIFARRPATIPGLLPTARAGRPTVGGVARRGRAARRQHAVVRHRRDDRRHAPWLGAACIADEPPGARVRGGVPGEGRCVVRKGHGRRACRAVGTVRCAVGACVMRRSPTRTATGWTCSRCWNPDAATPAARRRGRGLRGAGGVGRHTRHAAATSAFGSPSPSNRTARRNRRMRRSVGRPVAIHSRALTLQRAGRPADVACHVGDGRAACRVRR